jgi:hypothetical protein
MHFRATPFGRRRYKSPSLMQYPEAWHTILLASDSSSGSLLLTRKALSSRIQSIVGMTSGAYPGPCYLPAGVLGISTVLGREDRLRPKGRLCQRPAGDSTEESQSRAMKTRILQWLCCRKWPGPDKIDRGKGRE